MHYRDKSDRIRLAFSKVRRAGAYTSEDIHRRLFASTPKQRTLTALKEGIRKYARGAMHAIELFARDDTRQAAAAESFISGGA